MEIRALQAADSREAVSRIYEESWKSAYKGLIHQSYLDSIPSGLWAPSLDQPGSSGRPGRRQADWDSQHRPFPLAGLSGGR